MDADPTKCLADLGLRERELALVGLRWEGCNAVIHGVEHGGMKIKDVAGKQ